MKTFACLMILAGLVCGCASAEKPVSSNYILETRVSNTPVDNITLQDISGIMDEVTIYRLDSYKDGRRLENPIFHLVVPHSTSPIKPATQPIKKP
jgi:hypothetical protein